MFIGGDKTKVIENIKINLNNKEYNKKVEVDDPNLSDEELNKILDNFYKMRKHKIRFKISNKLTNMYVNHLTNSLDIELVGLEKLNEIKSGAIITSNHFNPIDSMIVRKVIRKKFHKDIYVVSQDTNLALPGNLGYLMNNLNIIPLSIGPNYINDVFKPNLKKILSNNNYVLIYPEEEMWFNYRLPRPCKKGAYRFASEFDVPIISCFVKMDDTQEEENAQFNKVKYTIYVLDIIYPNKDKTIRQNSIDMAKVDYDIKVKAYEECYQTKLDYKFKKSDIAGLR